MRPGIGRMEDKLLFSGVRAGLQLMMTKYFSLHSVLIDKAVSQLHSKTQCYENGLHCLHWVCNAYFFGNIVYIWSAFKQICLLFGISLTFFAHIYYISLTSLYYVILLVCRLQITTEPNGGLAVMVQLTRQKSLYYTIIISSPPAGSQDLSRSSILHFNPDTQYI